MEGHEEYQVGGIVPPADASEFRAVSADRVLLKPPEKNTLDRDTVVRIEEDAMLLWRLCRTITTTGRDMARVDVNNIRFMCLRLYELAYFPDEMKGE